MFCVNSIDKIFRDESFLDPLVKQLNHIIYKYLNSLKQELIRSKKH